MMEIHAVMPAESERVCHLSCELHGQGATPEQDRETAEFITLAIELGATGFYREGD